MKWKRMAVLLFVLLIRLPSNAGDVNQDLIDAAKNGDTAAVKALLASGADPNSNARADGWTVLMFAAKKGHTAAVDSLLAAGADVNAKDSSGWAALMWAVLVRDQTPVRNRAARQITGQVFQHVVRA